MYQARSLIGSDSSGLSDPFARIVVGEYCRTTQVKISVAEVSRTRFVTDKLHKVIDETLSPTWDELIVFGKMLVYGRKEDIKENPPMAIVEFYDQDKVCIKASNDCLLFIILF